MRIRNEAGSFKDPNGGIFYYKDKVFRWVTNEVGPFYQSLVKSDFFKNLVRSDFFIPTWPVKLSDDLNITKECGTEVALFEHEQIEFISFPYEWSVSMIIDAAIHTLNLQIVLLEKNLSLKDATPYNVQFRHTQPLFIDLCSIENASNNGIWIAYNQFCQTFLYPLLMFVFRSLNLRAIYLTHMDGINLDQVIRSLGFRPFIKYKMILDYLIPALITKLKQSKVIDITKKTASISGTVSNSTKIQLHTVRRLRKFVNKIRLRIGSSDWINYTAKCSYVDNDYSLKKEFIENFLETYEVRKVLDLGCNTGEMSIIAAKKGCQVVALDSDDGCVDYLYHTSKANHYPILPLCIDITNPSPSIGWLNTERPSFISRYCGLFDCVFALAFIHHLMITNRIPLMEIVSLFRHCTSRFLVVEYVGPADMMFQELLKYRNESYHDFGIDRFEGALSAYFSILRKLELMDRQRHMERCLYLMERRR